MRIYKLVSPVLFVLMLVGCSKKPTLTEFDVQSWMSDPHGCNGKRKQLLDGLLKQRDQLLSLDEMEMVDLIGKADAHEIYKRSEKFFYYSIDADSTCGTPVIHARKLVIRFNAVGLAKEISVEESTF